MPMYEYHCDACEKVTETLRPVRDADAAIECEHCGSNKTRRVQSVFAAGASQSNATTSLPFGGCGRCGDPQGPCGLN